MVRLIRAFSLGFLVVGLYLLGRNSFHLRDATTFFILTFLFCLMLTILFTVTRGR